MHALDTTAQRRQGIGRRQAHGISTDARRLRSGLDGIFAEIHRTREAKSDKRTSSTLRL
jgi:hypothetical protein